MVFDHLFFLLYLSENTETSAWTRPRRVIWIARNIGNPYRKVSGTWKSLSVIIFAAQWRSSLQDFCLSVNVVTACKSTPMKKRTLNSAVAKTAYICLSFVCLYLSLKSKSFQYTGHFLISVSSLLALCTYTLWFLACRLFCLIYFTWTQCTNTQTYCERYTVFFLMHTTHSHRECFKRLSVWCR